MTPYVLLFLGAVLEAVLVWMLATWMYGKHSAFLQAQIEEGRKTIAGLVDRIQSPQTQDLVARQKAQQDIEERKALPPPEREKIRQNLLFEEIMDKELWRQHPAFDGLEVIKDTSGDGVEVIGAVDPVSQLPEVEKLSRMKFCSLFV